MSRPYRYPCNFSATWEHLWQVEGSQSLEVHRVILWLLELDNKLIPNSFNFARAWKVHGQGDVEFRS